MRFDDKVSNLIQSVSNIEDSETTRRLLEKLVKREQSKHKSLKSVVISEQQPDWIQMPHLKGFEECTFVIPDKFETNYSGGELPTVGITRFFVNNETDEFASVVWVQKHDGEYSDTFALLFLAHEFGHVNDFEKKRFLVPGKLPDLVSTECSAHEYACSLFEKNGLRFHLNRYLDFLQTQHLNQGCEVQKEAAKRFFARPKTSHYINYAVNPYKRVGISTDGQ